MKHTLLILLLFIAVGCSSSREEITKAMNSWVGKSETQLVESWGAPDKVYKMENGMRTITYDFNRPGYQTGGYRWRDAYGGVHFVPGQREGRYEAKRDFTIDQNGIIQAVSWHGE